MTKLKAHLLQLPRWFAAPFFGGSLLIGAQLAGGLSLNAWIAFIAGMLLMAGGHSWNSYLDYWTGLDKGEPGERSAEKGYTGGQSLIALGIVSEREVLINACLWYVVALAPVLYLAIAVNWWFLFLALCGMAVTFWYTLIGKFNWTHELALGVGVGPIAVLMGMFAVNPHPNWLTGLIVSAPIAIILSFLGLALDEWPDAEANLKKGVKSVAYKVFEYGVSLEWYCSIWLIAVYVYQVFLITIGILKPLTGLTFLVFPPIFMLLVLLKHDFRRVMRVIVMVASLYPLLLLVGQIFGG